MRPSRIHLPIAGRTNSLVMDILVIASERFEYLIIKPTDPAHRKNRCQLPVLVITAIGRTDSIRVPALRCTRRCLQDPPTYVLRHIGIKVEFAE